MKKVILWKNTILTLLVLVGVESSLLVQAEGSHPTDAQIMAIVVAANQGEVDAGTLATSKTQEEPIRNFANKMVTDHSDAKKQTLALSKKLGMKPQESDTSVALEKDSHAQLAELQKANGAAFNQAYADYAVASHQSVLNEIDQVLLPSAKNTELKALIEKIRPTVLTHLEHAKKMQAHLKPNAS